QTDDVENATSEIKLERETQTDVVYNSVFDERDDDLVQHSSKIILPGLLLSLALMLSLALLTVNGLLRTNEQFKFLNLITVTTSTLVLISGVVCVFSIIALFLWGRA